jgi:hypothetical protein
MHMFQLDRKNWSASSRRKARLFSESMFYFALMLLLMIATIAIIPRARAAETPMQREYLKKLDEPVLLRGDYFKAAMSAYSDFESELSKNASAATSANTPNPSLASWLSKIENYDIHVSQSAGHIVVQFNPTVRGKFLPVLGGGARYEIDKGSFAILSKVFSK